jgi:anti-anti-sigma factor
MGASAHLEAIGDHTVVIRASGDFDLATSRTLAAALTDATGSGRDVVVDLAEAAFVDVYCLRLVLATQELLAQSGRTVVVINAPPVFQRLVSVLQIPDLIAV